MQPSAQALGRKQKEDKPRRGERKTLTGRDASPAKGRGRRAEKTTLHTNMHVASLRRVKDPGHPSSQVPRRGLEPRNLLSYNGPVTWVGFSRLVPCSAGGTISASLLAFKTPLKELRMAIQKTDNIWHNGKLIHWDDATIHVMSHVVHYGSSVFEGIRCYALPSGPGIFRANEHMQRLLDSAKVYRIDVDFTRDELVKGCSKPSAHNGAWPCYVRPIVLRGYGEAGVNPFNSPDRGLHHQLSVGKISGRRDAMAATSASRRGRASLRTLCLPWPRPAPIT